ncbi:4907_t:CDS:2 [Acaulospora morrowiae]|uniref:4907_t:CDS:1 n=1 Tax=Acaulospora morrowiae TaxID=94023 RepID=A0A9N9FVZ3_9GLOM|nr:4907_t:CDS:2 [Acaulospora morrowiae]
MICTYKLESDVNRWQEVRVSKVTLLREKVQSDERVFLGGRVEKDKNQRRKFDWRETKLSQANIRSLIYSKKEVIKLQPIKIMLLSEGIRDEG